MKSEPETIKITLDRQSALYRVGEKARFAITVCSDEKLIRNRMLSIQFSCDCESILYEKQYYCHGLENRETYFFRRATLGIYRAIEWLAQRKDVDPSRIVFSGASQGGTMAFFQDCNKRH